MNGYLKTYFFDIIFKKFFDFTGRATRKEFWFFTLNILIVIAAIYAIFYFDGPNIGPVIFERMLNAYPSYDTIIFLRIILALIFIFPVIFLLPFINLLARRLHDIGLTAKYLFVAVLLIRYVWVLPFIIAIIGCIPGKKEGNKYDNQDIIKNNIIKKIFVNGTILTLILFFLIFMPKALVKNIKQAKAEGNLIINKIAQSELKYFSENNYFLSVDKVNSNDILDINMQDYKYFDTFSCTINQESFDNKSVEIEVWPKIDDNQKKKYKDSYYSSYICATQYQNGELSKMILKLEKKTVV